MRKIEKSIKTAWKYGKIPKSKSDAISFIKTHLNVSETAAKRYVQKRVLPKNIDQWIDAMKEIKKLYLGSSKEDSKEDSKKDREEAKKAIRFLEKDEIALQLLLDLYLSDEYSGRWYTYVDHPEMGIVMRFDLNFLKFYAERVGIESKELSSCSTGHYLRKNSKLSAKSISMILEAEQNVLNG